MYAEKLLPHDLEAEEAVVGSLLIDGEAISFGKTQSGLRSFTGYLSQRLPLVAIVGTGGLAVKLVIM